MNPETLRTLQLIELKILLEFKRICDKHHLEYFMEGGTLLGAVRHKGFIPWDDDVDVGMKRSEYEKFLKIAPDELGDEFFLQIVGTDSGHWYHFAKIRLNGTSYPSHDGQGVLNHEGLWIDIFPFDYIPENKLKQWIQFKKVYILNYYILTYVFGHNPRHQGLKKVEQSILKHLCKLVPKNKALSLRDAQIRKYTDNPTEYCSNFWPCKSKPAAILNHLIPLEFEGFQFSAPEIYDEYLTHIYGDYMTPPPEDQRHPIHCDSEPEFGKYSSIKTLDDLKSSLKTE